MLLDPLSVNIPFEHTTQRPQLPQRKLLTPSPDHPDDYILELDYSHGISTFLKCQRQWQNINLNAREANRPTAAKDFGTLFHSCEELRLREGLTDAVILRQREMVAAHFLSHPVPPDEYRHADRMRKILDQYNKLYAIDQWPESVLVHNGHKTVEVPFKIELTTLEVDAKLPFPRPTLVKYTPEAIIWGEHKYETHVRNLHVLYTGKIDAVLTNSNLLWVVDHKTSSRGGGEFEEAFNLSLQTRGYCWAAQKILDREVAGCIINAVVTRKETPTGKPTDFIRNTHFYSQDSLDEWEANAKATVEDIVSSLLRGYFPQAAQSFMSPCRMCDFSENCRLSPSQRAADLSSNLYRDVTWSPTNET